MKQTSRIALLVAVAVWAPSSYAGWAILNQEQSVPTPSTVEGAIGTAVVELNEAETELAFSITVTGLSGSIAAAHFHGPADPGEGAGPVRTLAFEGSHARGVWSSTDSEPLTPDLVAELKAGRIYLNIHTQQNAPGEIRGQVHLGGSFNATLDQAQSVPTPSVVAGAGGTAFLRLNADESEATFHVTVTGLSGPIAAAHIHGPADPGAGASPVRTLAFDGEHADGVWTASDSEPLTAEWVQALKDGKLYVNIHTPDNGPGEIRGQILEVDAATSHVHAYGAYE